MTLPTPPPQTREKVRLALEAMGFRAREARNAVAEMERMHPDTEFPTVVDALREAVLVATATRFELRPHDESRSDAA